MQITRKRGKMKKMSARVLRSRKNKAGIRLCGCILVKLCHSSFSLQGKASIGSVSATQTASISPNPKALMASSWYVNTDLGIRRSRGMHTIVRTRSYVGTTRVRRQDTKSFRVRMI